MKVLFFCANFLAARFILTAHHANFRRYDFRGIYLRSSAQSAVECFSCSVFLRQMNFAWFVFFAVEDFAVFECAGLTQFCRSPKKIDIRSSFGRIRIEGCFPPLK
jgi:hypothetical protein